MKDTPTNTPIPNSELELINVSNVDHSIIWEEKRLMEEIEPQMTKIFKEFTGGSKVWLTTDFFKKVYREMCLAQLVIVGLYEEVNRLKTL